MVSEIRVYLEGAKQLRPAMKGFLRDVDDLARRKRCRFEVIPCKATAVKSFCYALSDHPDAFNVLLVDSDAPYDRQLGIRLKDRRDWNPPPGSGDLNGNVFWMVQIMEAWFLADPDALEAFYGSGFRRGVLRPNPNVEQVQKEDVMSSLAAATKDTSKGGYHKTRHAPHLLALIDPQKVQRSATNCKRLFDGLNAAIRGW